MSMGTFTREVIEYAAQIDTTIFLFDGQKLARLMLLHNVGCAPAQTSVVKKLDSDSFVEEVGTLARGSRGRMGCCAHPLSPGTRPRI